jgi:glycosyltransferase involved in cell wall biosynthesis
MLAPWALRHKAWKKRLAWWLYQRRDLSRATLLAATSEQEVRDIRRLVPGKKIALVPNGVELPKDRREEREERKEKTAVFLGRIHPVKGLKNLLEAWHLVRPDGWRCILAGPDEADHRRELDALLRSHHLEDSFEFPGLLEDEQKWALLRKADLFVLPSFTENFAVAVAEALASGVPVITTRGAPWKELQTRRCGWWVDIGVEPLAAALEEATSLSDQERHEMGQRGRHLVEENYSWPRVASEMLPVYQWVLGKDLRPASISLR